MRGYWFREALFGGVEVGDHVEVKLALTYFVVGIEVDRRTLGIRLGPVSLEIWRPRRKGVA